MGPIPREALVRQYPEVKARGESYFAVPNRGQAIQLVGLANAPSFVDLARQGFFVFDWSDVHRPPRATKLRNYEAQAVPTRPILAAELPERDRSILVILEKVDFVRERLVDIRALVDCVERAGPRPAPGRRGHVGGER